MQCQNCGRPLRPGETTCPNCGEPVVPDPQRAPAAVDFTPPVESYQSYTGVPVDPYAPTIYGPPIGADQYRGAPPSFAPPQRVAGYRPISPLAPPLQRSGGCLRPTIVLGALCLVAFLLVGVLVLLSQNLGGLNRGAGSAHTTTGATTQAAPACPLPTVNSQAAQALTTVQLTTGVRDAQHNDLHPVDNVSTFVVGQTVYVTFQIATQEPGSIIATFCTTHGALATSTRAVPQGYQGALGEFHLIQALAPTNVGRGSVVIEWNGAVAAALPFTVAAH